MNTTQLAAALYQLQQFDLELERLQNEQQAIKSSLQENSDLHMARLEHAKAQKQLQAGLLTQKEAEIVLEDLSYRLGLQEQRLYSGSVNNPKELHALQQEVQRLRSQQSRQEEVVLEIMDTTERIQELIRRKAEALKQVEQQWQTESASKITHAGHVEERQREVQVKRAQLAQSIDAAALTRYEYLRRSRQGRPVSKVEQNSCQWCRVILTPSELQHVRVSAELQTCTNCGRILYYSR